jgi:hypothetical protein
MQADFNVAEHPPSSCPGKNGSRRIVHLGGVANNVRSDTGPRGRGIFAVDPSKPGIVRTLEESAIDQRDALSARTGARDV